MPPPGAGTMNPPTIGAYPNAVPVGYAGNLYAGFWLRFVAYIIDGIILGACAVPIILLFGGASIIERMASGGRPEEFAPEMFGMFALWEIGIFGGVWIYYALLESSSWQATLGKKALGLYVTDMEGRRISFGRATGRYFAKIISGMTFLIGYIMAGFTARKQALHDLIAGTLVMRKN